MTIEEAIQHCRDNARKQKAKAYKYTKNYLMYAAKDCEECAAEHEQLAEWLTELKQSREAEITAQPKSNADRIRQMTDEELAKFIDTVTDCCADGWMCDKCPIKSNGCDEYIFIEWLKQEVKTDDER